MPKVRPYTFRLLWAEFLLLATKLKFHLYCIKTLFQMKSLTNLQYMKQVEVAILERLEMQTGYFQSHPSPDSCRGSSTEPEPIRISISFCGIPLRDPQIFPEIGEFCIKFVLGFFFWCAYLCEFCPRKYRSHSQPMATPILSGVCVCINCMITWATSDSILVVMKRERNRVWYITKQHIPSRCK